MALTRSGGRIVGSRIRSVIASGWRKLEWEERGEKERRWWGRGGRGGRGNVGGERVRRGDEGGGEERRSGGLQVEDTQSSKHHDEKIARVNWTTHQSDETEKKQTEQS
jgi:hypothetical protein